MAQRTKGSLGAEFAAATPASVKAVGGDPAALNQLAAIERRAASVKERFRAHYQKYQEVWVAKEAVKIWRLRGGLSSGPVPASAHGKEITANGVMADARRNVHARAIGRISNVNSIKTRLSNAVVRNAQSNKLSQTFKSANDVEASPSMRKKRKLTP